MIRAALILAVLLGGVAVLSAQEPARQAAFEVASIKPAPKEFSPSVTLQRAPDRLVSAQAPSDARFEIASVKENRLLREQAGGFGVTGMLASGHYEAVYVTVTQLIRMAYESPDYRVSGGPERTDATPCGPRFGVRYDRGEGRFSARAQPLATLLGFLGGAIGLPVVNNTGLTGDYDVDIKWPMGTGVGFPFEPAGPESSASLFTAVREQLGLKLVQRDADIEVLVIESVERSTPD